MTVQDFCIEYRLPISTTSRLIRKLVEEHVRTDVSNDSTAIEGGFQHDLREHGFTAARGKRKARTTYDVYDPYLLFRTIFSELKYEAVPDSDLDFLAGAARMLHNVAYEKSEWILVHRDNGDAFSPSESYFDKLEGLLRRIGK